jgi:PAS domain S-box-containing protein
MRVRTKFILTLLGITLLPFLLIGRLVYRRGETALRESLGASFERMAAEAIDKVDRSLHEVQQNVQTWAGLELMQEVVTGDLDGKIASFLLGVQREYKTFSRIEVFDASGEVVASSDPSSVGRPVSDEATLSTALSGRGAVRDVRRDELGAAWVVVFCYPILAQFDDARTVGAVCARWNATELTRMVQVGGMGDSPAADIIVIRKDGLLISSPSIVAGSAFMESLIERGWQSAVEASDGGRGFLVESFAGGRSYLIGYSRSVGYGSFEPLGWSALVLQDVDSAFQPVRELELIFLSGGALLALTVVGLSLAIGHTVTKPLVRMADAAERVARGDFDARVSYRSGDEIGTLATVFDAMVANLKHQRAQLVEDIARRERAEKELRVAKETAEESTAKFSAVLNTMSEGIVTIDASGTLVMVNQQVGRIWGYEASELVGRPAEILLSPAERRPQSTRFERYLREPPTDDPDRRFVTEGLRKDGSSFPIEVSAAKTRIGDRVLVTVALRDITERKRSEEQINAALAEKEALLKEIHHRVKNNLQVIVSLLHLQSDHVKEEPAHGVLLDSESRVKSMAFMHEKLYRSKDLSRIHVADYIETLARDLTRSYRISSSGAALTCSIADLSLGMDSAIHCGLLVNELVSNALKHAFRGRKTGCVSVELQGVSDGRYRLVVRDDGVGLPAQIDTRRSETLGLQLVHTLAEHLDGTVTIRREGGTEFEIVFRDIDERPSAAE